MKHEWKKAEKQFYQPKNKPEFVNIPAFKFFSIAGRGNPNHAFFSDYISVLYAVSYSVKMSYKQGLEPLGYFDYTVYPLEGVWDITDQAKQSFNGTINKDDLVFTLMIRQPDFVHEDFANEMIARTMQKKPHPLLSSIQFQVLQEGDCIQMLHLGSYDNEPTSFDIMETFATQNGYRRKSKLHREIYLSDARKVSPDRLKTVLRFGVE